METGTVLAAFRSRQQAIAFDMQLHAQGFTTRVVSSPTQIARGCGVAVRLNNGQLCDVMQLNLHSGYNGFEGFYQQKQINQRGSSRWTRMSESECPLR